MKTRRPTLRQLEYFVTVALTLNFRQAAQRLEISQPTLTAQLATLEQVLGVSLFERSRAGTLLSAQGKALLEPAQGLLAQMRAFEELVNQQTGNPATTFRLGVPPTVGPYLLPFVLPDLHQRYQTLKLFVRESPPRQLLRDLHAGTYDLVLAPLPVTDDELSVHTLFTEPLKFVVPADHALADEAVIDPARIRGEQVLTLEEQHHFYQQVREVCNRLGAQVLEDYEGTSLDTLRQMVVMGLGVSFLPGLYIHSELHRPEELHVAELAGEPIVRQHALIWRNTSPSRVFFRELAADIRRSVSKSLAGVVQVV